MAFSRVQPWTGLVLCLVLRAADGADSFSPSKLSFFRPTDGGPNSDNQGEDVQHNTRGTWSQGSELSSRVTAPVAGEEAMVVFEATPNMALYRGESIKITLPGFVACGIMSMRPQTCDLQSASFIPRTSFPGKAFKPRWFGATESLELEVLEDIIEPGLLRVEVIGGIVIPLNGVTSDAGIRWSIEFNSPARPTGLSSPTAYSARSAIGATAFDTLQQVGSLSNVQLSFDTMATPGDALALTFAFTLRFAMLSGEHIFFHLPAFGGAAASDISLEGADASLFNASWGATELRTVSSVPPDAGLSPDIPSTSSRLLGAEEGTTLTLTSTGSINAGAALNVVVPAAAGIKLPYAGLCSVADVVSCLVESDATAGPMAPMAITKHGGLVGTSHRCGGDPPQVTAPGLVHLGHDIVVEWQRPHDDTELSTDLLQRSQRTDWIGLYRKGECKQPEIGWGAQADVGWDRTHDQSTLSDVYQTHQGIAIHANRCYLASRSVSVNGAQHGQHSGHVIFHFDDYKIAGEYEARYFRGDTAAGAGMICRGLRSVDYTIHGGTAVTCSIHASAQSGVISVEGTPNKARCEGVPSGPGVFRC